ncbi:MAG: glycosyltransferase [Candidatus Curtissbacteria bacterium]|nr:glycosyltransferase [Candidatus Curtissbacteria bacterium]
MRASQKPQVSVIMSVHNGMPYLKEAVKSILSQTYKNFEFIIVDDASTDKSLKYLKSVHDKRIKLIKNSKNLGLATSLNKALKVAKGEYIARMDADDISLPKRLETQLNFLIKNPKVDLCGSWAELINEEGRTVGEKKYPKNDKEIKKALGWYPPLIHPTWLARTEFYEKTKGYDIRFDMAEDYELLVRAKEKFQMANIGQKLLLWRLGNKRRSRQHFRQMDLTDLRIKRKALQKGYFGRLYILTVIKKTLMVYLIPLPIKVRIAKFLKVA